ncbi:TPA: hypothetical protein N0F65_007699 [Lagenidium giganteum]|uniref:PCI domain-containing protein n=1 Tax=Lagenidium giganteum TaxID=4803 RepID=A0AAV2Z453_9STRA|nr:TPA: hypothetical protein N0F65_007699 [Lagenidium giganteum]
MAPSGPLHGAKWDGWLLYMRLHRWSDWVVVYVLALLFFGWLRLLALPIYAAKWASAFHDNWAWKCVGLALGAMQDVCVVTALCLMLWPFDALSLVVERSWGRWHRSHHPPTASTPARDQESRSDGQHQAGARVPRPRDTRTEEEQGVLVAAADMAARMVRLIVYAAVFLIAVVLFCADNVVLRSRKMRFTVELLAMYQREKDAVHQLEIADEEWALLHGVIALACVFAILFGLLGAVWLNLAEWEICSTILCLLGGRQRGKQQRYKRVKLDEVEANEQDKQQGEQELATNPTRSRRLSILVVVLLVPLLWLGTTLALSKVLPSLVAVIALNASLNEPARLLFGVEFFSQRMMSVDKPVGLLLDANTEQFELFSPDALYRRTLGFQGPKAFDVRVEADERPNVLILTIESFRYRDSRYLLQNMSEEFVGNVTLTPNFDKWAQRGVGFRNFWSTWRTSRSLETTLFGQLPYDSVTSTGTTGGRNGTKLSGIPHLLKELGYNCTFTTGSRTDYDDWDTFLPSHGFDTVVDMNKMIEITENEMDIDWNHGDRMMSYWGLHDDLSFEVLLHILKQKEEATPKQPWFVNHYTISSHVPFDEKPDWYYRNLHSLPDFSSLYKGHEHSELIQHYAEMRYFTDLVFGRLMTQLENLGILNNTIVFVLGDHGQAPEKGSSTPEVDQVSATCVAAALIAQGRLGSHNGTIIDGPAAQYDVLNTIADIVGIPQNGFLQSGVGQSLLRQIAADRVVYANNPATNMAAIQGHTRIEFFPEMSDAMRVYNTEFDYFQQHDVLTALTPHRIQEITRICDTGRLLSAYFKHRWDQQCILAPTCATAVCVWWRRDQRLELLGIPMNCIGLARIWSAAVARPTAVRAFGHLTAPALAPRWVVAAQAVDARWYSSAKNNSGGKWGFINERIRARVVSVVGEDGKMQDDVPIGKALQQAKALGLDLVQVSQNGAKVVCRMFDAQKRLFNMKKAAKQAKAKPEKEMIFSVKIAEHDMQFKVDQVKKFLTKGHKVKVTIKFGKEYHLKDKAPKEMETVTELIGEAGQPDAIRDQFGGIYRFFTPVAAKRSTARKLPVRDVMGAPPANAAAAKPADAKKKQLKKQASVGNISEEVEDALNTLPHMNVSEVYFLLQHQHSPASTLPAHETAYKDELMAYIKKYNMTPFYKAVCKEFNWPVDEALLSEMTKSNEEELKLLEERLKDAQENLGDIEVLDALWAKARMYSRIGDKEAALEAFGVAGEKPQSSNQKIMVALHIIRIGLFFADFELVEQYIKKATELIDEGGDWDRRNRLKVYEGCYLLMTRDFKKASKLFQASVATFTATELMTYNKMIFYCIITCVMSSGRVELKKHIVDSPEVLAVIGEIPHLTDFLNGLYECNYKRFFTAMVDLQPHILRDKYLWTHVRFMYRELRVLAYAQFLEAYRSVTMDSMAQAFGVSVEFLDTELARFIAAGRLNAKIDKVGGVIETNRPDSKNAQYQDAIKKGDLLLNRIQKLARVINV